MRQWQLEIEQLRRHLLQLQHQKSTTSNTATCTSTLSPSTTAPATAIGGNIKPVSPIYQPHPSHTHTITSTPLPLSTTSAGKRSSAAVVRSHSSKRRGKVTSQPTAEKDPFWLLTWNSKQDFRTSYVNGRINWTFLVVLSPTSNDCVYIAIMPTFCSQ